MPADPGVSTLLSLLIVVALVASVVRFIRIPYEITLVLVGLLLALAPGVPRIAISPGVILLVFLPVLLFHAGYNLPLTDLRINLLPISVLAVPGVFVGAGLVALALHAIGGLAWSSAILFGTIVSATDPVSVLALFSRVGAPARLTAIVTGESLFNDGTALVLFVVALDAATGGHVTLLGGTMQVVAVIAGSLVMGVVVGLLGAQILSRFNDALLETTISLIIAYGGYLLANDWHMSGALETVTAGIILGSRGSKVMSRETRLQARATWEFLVFLTNSLLFLLIGMAVRSVAAGAGIRLGSQAWGLLLVALLAVLVSRIVVVWVTQMTMEAVGQGLPASWRPVLVWAGLRGAVSLAAVLSLPNNVPDRDTILVLTFGVVLFTLLVQGLTMQPLLRRQGLIGEDEADDATESTAGEHGQSTRPGATA
ncbi:MAG: Na+/H+ antiporter [Chloroflexi bacterium]|nr:Na+/H+ antiporter [Chloroflexota bacterium]